MTKLTGQGGPDRGQGRRYLDGSKPGEGRYAKRVTVTLPPDMLKWLDNQPGKNRAQKIQNLISERMNQ